MAPKNESQTSESPSLIPPEYRAMRGLDALKAMLEKGLLKPPMADTLNFWLAEVDEGRTVFEGEPTAAFLNPYGTVHGGWALTLLDSCTACAAHTLLPAGVAYTTLETKANFVKPITCETGRVRAEGRVVSPGRTIITAEGRITDTAGRVLAHGTSTLFVLPR